MIETPSPTNVLVAKRRGNRLDRRAAGNRKRACRRAAPQRRARVRHAGHPGARVARPCQGESVKYVRFQIAGKKRWGRLKGSVIHEVDGNVLKEHRETGRKLRLGEVRLLPPARPT